MRRLEMLGELAELGLEVARAVERQATDPSAPQSGDVALAYARVSRAVRLTLMLQARLIDDMKAPKTAPKTVPGPTADEAEVTAEPHRLGPADQRKARIERIVERLAESEHPDDDDHVADLVTEAGERLDDEDLFGDLLDIPISEAVARLCKDLGLEPDWSELAQELWAVKEVESGHVGRPLSAYLARARQRAGGGARDDDRQAEAFHQRLQDLARDPAILAAAGRNTS
jgi:hypothetical protein